MAIVGAHVLLYSSEAEALRATLRDVSGWKHVDAGDGWLIFALPPAELGVHPAEGPTYESGVRHQFTLMCDDIEATIRELRAKGSRCGVSRPTRALASPPCWPCLAGSRSCCTSPATRLRSPPLALGWHLT